MNWPKQSFALVVSGSLILATAQAGRAEEVEQSMGQPTAAVIQQSSEALDQIVAPIALYPDNLIAQILAASTDPSEIVEADRWVQDNSGLDSIALAQAVDQQSWDPSVKALTQFPLVLQNMDQNLSWTSALGSAYGNEPQNVLNAVQAMRQRAQQAGNLMSTPQQTVTSEGDTITIQPAEADTVYLPEYDPWLVYGSPVAVYPGWNDASGLYLDRTVCAVWPRHRDRGLRGIWLGLPSLGNDWHGHSVVYNHNNYVARSHAFASHNVFYGAPTSFDRSGGFNVGAWHRPVGLRYGALQRLQPWRCNPDLRFPCSPALAEASISGMRETPYRVSSSTPTDGPHRPPLRSTSRQANSWATLRAPPASANSWHRVAIR